LLRYAKAAYERACRCSQRSGKVSEQIQFESSLCTIPSPTQFNLIQVISVPSGLLNNEVKCEKYSLQLNSENLKFSGDLATGLELLDGIRRQFSFAYPSVDQISASRNLSHDALQGSRWIFSYLDH
jgi:hypothetical protein